MSTKPHGARVVDFNPCDIKRPVSQQWEHYRLFMIMNHEYVFETNLELKKKKLKVG